MEDPNMKIEGAPVSKILETVSRIVALTPHIPGNEAPERRGGYLTISDEVNGNPLLVERIGRCLPCNVNMYHGFSIEKGGRIKIVNTLVPRQDHTIYQVSSHQSRDPKNGKWGGAIVASNLIISFSGLKELFDEAVVIVLARKFKWLSATQAKAIAEISDNKFVDPLYNYLLEIERQEDESE